MSGSKLNETKLEQITTEELDALSAILLGMLHVLTRNQCRENILEMHNHNRRFPDRRRSCAQDCSLVWTGCEFPDRREKLLKFVENY